ncbi:unnamed protein product [Oikopleura dioica]|uniref:GH16 domain-containing protein n=1 Tax=Oikopleura dioica TaxID=34765 RepID=E4XGL2_OIKDI|nr:unnamed protein product [Oikopleura dioica]
MMKWHCHDPNAKGTIDMTLGNGPCTNAAWGTIGCCYQGDNGAGCNRDNLLSDADDMADYRFRTLEDCPGHDFFQEPRSVPTTTTTSTSTTTTETPGPWIVGETEVFYDNFTDYDTFRDQWIVEVTPDPHNNELQYYTDRKDNADIVDETLVLTAKRENFGHRQYTSGRVVSKYAFKYGKVEVVAKTPAGRGLWPAIWLLPEEEVYGGWPRSGEIDIFEGRGQNPQEMLSTIHFGPLWPNNQYLHGPNIQSDCDYTTDFHKWTLEWTPNELVYSFDDEVTYIQSLDTVIDSYYGNNWQQPFDQYFHIILNTAIGGDFVDGPDANDEWSYPEAEFQIDSIKITPFSDIIDPTQTTCESSANCDNCKPDTATCSGTNNYERYKLLSEPVNPVQCTANTAKSKTDLCWGMKWFCHDPNAQIPFNWGSMDVCNGKWETIGCCYSGDNGAGCNQASLSSDVSDLGAKVYEITGECSNRRGQDSSASIIKLGGDLSVSCEAI